MASASLGSTVLRLRSLAAEQHRPSLGDDQLLGAFVGSGDQSAFAELVRRHGALVFGVCNNVLRHEQDAEDAFQAAFLTLAQKAASIRNGKSLAAWLHGVAFHIAWKIRRAAARRRAHESRAVPVPQASWDVAWREVQAVLDAEVQRLPAIYRDVFVLCCMEGCGRDEAAGRLGLKKGTVASRLAKARQRLQERLTRRGLALSAVLAACSLTRDASAARAAALLRPTVRMAQGRAGVPGDVVALLSPAAVRGKVILALVLVLGLAAACTSVALRSAPAAPPATPPAPKVSRTQPPQPEPAIAEKADRVFVSGRVLGPDRLPFAGAKVYLGYAAPVAGKHKVRAVSGQDGCFRFSYPKTVDTPEDWITARAHYWRFFSIIVAAPGHGQAEVWMPDIKGELTLRLVKEVAVKGRVLDLEGRPVAGATVRVLHHTWSMVHSPVTTERDGSFVVPGVGRDGSVELHVSGPTIEIQRVKVSTRPSVNVKVIAGPTKVIEGVVRARDSGKPLAGVTIYGKDRAFNTINTDEFGPKAITDARGRYRLVGLSKSKKYEVIASPPPRLGYLLGAKWVADTEGLRPLTADFDLRRGIRVRLRLLDKPTRKPVHGTAQYTLARSNPLWAEAVSPYNPGLVLPPRVWFPGRCTNKNGIIEFVAYPGHGAVFIWAAPSGPAYPKARLAPADEKKGYFPLSKGEPNNGFLNLANTYRVLDTDKTDKLLTFDIELIPEKPAK